MKYNSENIILPSNKWVLINSFGGDPFQTQLLGVGGCLFKSSDTLLDVNAMGLPVATEDSAEELTEGSYSLPFKQQGGVDVSDTSYVYIASLQGATIVRVVGGDLGTEFPVNPLGSMGGSGGGGGGTVTIPDATETVKGKTEIATQAEVDAGTDDFRYVTPLKLKNSGTIPDATETVKGKTEIATQAEVDAGTDDFRYVTPLKLKNSGTIPDATETVKGKTEIATQEEVDAGTDDFRYVTPLKLKGYIDQGKWVTIDTQQTVTGRKIFADLYSINNLTTAPIGYKRLDISGNRVDIFPKDTLKMSSRRVEMRSNNLEISADPTADPGNPLVQNQNICNVIRDKGINSTLRIGDVISNDEGVTNYVRLGNSSGAGTSYNTIELFNSSGSGVLISEADVLNITCEGSASATLNLFNSSGDGTGSVSANLNIGTSKSSRGSDTVIDIGTWANSTADATKKHIINIGTASSSIADPSNTKVNLGANVLTLGAIPPTPDYSTGAVKLLSIDGSGIVSSMFQSAFTVPSASETVQGKAEIATQAEVDAGIDDSRFITPLKLKRAVQPSSSVESYTIGVVFTNDSAEQTALFGTTSRASGFYPLPRTPSSSDPSFITGDFSNGLPSWLSLVPLVGKPFFSAVVADGMYSFGTCLLSCKFDSKVSKGTSVSGLGTIGFDTINGIVTDKTSNVFWSGITDTASVTILGTPLSPATHTIINQTASHIRIEGRSDRNPTLTKMKAGITTVPAFHTAFAPIGFITINKHS